jgi:hypothetical protein
MIGIGPNGRFIEPKTGEDGALRAIAAEQSTSSIC